MSSEPISYLRKFHGKIEGLRLYKPIEIVRRRTSCVIIFPGGVGKQRTFA